MIRSIRHEFPEEYYGDELINTVLTFGINSIKDSFYSFQVMSLMNSIQTKLEAIVDSAFTFDSSADLIKRTEPDK